MSDHLASSVRRACLCACALSSLAYTERLPVKVYTAADGLAHNSVHRIVSDKGGLIWFCTAEGLSRFDGYGFRNFGTADGLPEAHVYDILETRSGDYWVATAGGLCRTHASKLDHPSEEKAFTSYSLPPEAGLEVHSLAEARDGTLWVGTAKGLCRSVQTGKGEVFQVASPQIPNQSNWPLTVTALLEDDFQSLWIGTGNGLFRRWPDGRVERHRARALEEGSKPWINNLRKDSRGRIWASTNKGLFTLTPTRLGSCNEHLFTHTSGMRIDFVFDAVVRPDHSLWAVSLDGVSRLLPSGPPSAKHLEPVTASMGLADFPLEAIALDRDQNAWVGSDGGGVSRIARNGFVSFNEADGLGSHDIISVFENPNGKLCAVSRSRDALFVNTVSGKGLHAIRVNVPSDLVSMRWHGHYQVTANIAQDWWVATRLGLARFSGIKNPAELAHVRPRIYRRDENIFRLFQDRRGDLWISDQHYPENVLTVRNHRTGAFDRFPKSNGGPDLINDRIQAYSEDRAGDVWMGLEHGGLWRRSAAGFHHFSVTETFLGRSINSLFTDREGRLWVGSSTAGVDRVDNPETEHPSFATYDTRQGLSSNEILCITEDFAGQIYLCTARGVDRLEPTTGHIKRYTTADGLPSGELQAAFCDRFGALWFGTQQGLARLVPTNQRPAAGAPVMLSGIRVQGEALAIRPAGETIITLPDLRPGRDRIQFDFTGLSFEAGDFLRYQFVLKGAEDTWSLPSSQRSVIYAGLHPGNYRFLVRAINSDGMVSPQPASVAFAILAPFWMRWWFLAFVFGTISLAIDFIRRYRARQLMAVERVRMRIATDLHDDIGSGLSQIAILSEVVKRQVTEGAVSVLDQIAGVSRELVDSMSDIVWATDPHRDQVGDLSQRMREFAGEVLGGSEIRFRLLLGGINEKRKLSVNVRRQVYLVYKECINNVVHHSGSTEAMVSLDCDASSLALEVSDNGMGFDVMESSYGHGLASLRDRAAKLGGNIEWISSRTGTTVKMRVPYTFE